MRDIFMTLLMFLKDVGCIKIESMNLSKTSRYSDIDIDYQGKRFNIAIREEEAE